MSEKIGLVVEGGGMKCAYSAGVLDRFIDDGISFDYAVGVSAGSANTVSFLSHQRGRTLRFYTSHIHEPGYFGVKSWLKTGNLFGLQYIYGTLTNEGGPDALDYQALMANPTEFEAVVTDARTGKPCYLGKSLIGPCDYREIMASCALLAACKPVELDGSLYFDGGVSDSIPVDHALGQGCDKLVVLLSKTRDYVKGPQKPKGLYHALCRKYPKVVEALDNRHIMYGKCQKRTYQLEAEGRAFVFAPSKPFSIGTYTMDEKDNRALYDMGISDYDDLREEFLQFMGR